LSGWSLYLDEDNHDHDLAEALRRSGLETHGSGDHGMDATSDEDQLEFAAAHAFVLYTSNLRDYERLHRERLETGLTHAGIISALAGDGQSVSRHGAFSGSGKRFRQKRW
jgi:hypothetical protein